MKRFSSEARRPERAKTRGNGSVGSRSANGGSAYFDLRDPGRLALKCSPRTSELGIRSCCQRPDSINGPSSLLRSTATIDTGLTGEVDEGLATTDADHAPLVNRQLSHRLARLEAVFGDRDEDQDLVRDDFDAKMIDDELVALLASKQNGS